ncbi:MAG: hypothetical protein P9M02_05645 [Candidatus Susulua stagnicola]|nr:hypothetical protein [Candidatus Susulua stagnicola]
MPLCLKVNTTTSVGYVKVKIDKWVRSKERGQLPFPNNYSLRLKANTTFPAGYVKVFYSHVYAA